MWSPLTAYADTSGLLTGSPHSLTSRDASCTAWVPALTVYGAPTLREASTWSVELHSIVPVTRPPAVFGSLTLNRNVPSAPPTSPPPSRTALQYTRTMPESSGTSAPAKSSVATALRSLRADSSTVPPVIEPYSPDSTKLGNETRANRSLKWLHPLTAHHRPPP